MIIPRSHRAVSQALVTRMLLVMVWLLVVSVTVAASNDGKPSVGAAQSAANGSAAPVIISPSAATGVVNTSFNYQLALADFQAGTYTATGLPTGLSLDPLVGVISGSPTTVGIYSVALSATNVNGTGTATLVLTVLPAGPPDFTSVTNATGQVGTAFNFQSTADNEPTSYAATGLPAGLAINASTGSITGTPTQAGQFHATLVAANARGSGSSLLDLSISAPLPMVTLTANVPAAYPRRRQSGGFLLTRTGDTSMPLTVTFSIKGSGRNGVDYKRLPFTATIKAGKSVKRIKVVGFDQEGEPDTGKTTVKLTLEQADTYLVGAAGVAKVKIFYAR